MTEYQVEQKQAERRALVQISIDGQSMADRDRAAGYEVRTFCGSWFDYKTESRARMAEGWEVPIYGAWADLLTISCYFRRKLCKCGAPIDPADGMDLCPSCFDELMSR